jgi:mannitol-1-phosphate 5-dehydrogenase
MARHGNAIFVGFGFGAIQAGLFCFEAHAAGAFRRLVVAEVVPETVAALRRAGGYYTVNVAHPEHRTAVTVGPVQVENPDVPADRARLVEAVAAAQEIATAVPSVGHYVTKGPGSLHRILAEGLQRKAVTGGPHAVVYAAENQTHAARLLRDAVMAEVPEQDRAAVDRAVRFVDTVIAKMSGVVAPPGDLAPVTPDGDRAFLVEEFNHILVGRVEFGPDAPRFVRGLRVFEEKDDLLPFEEAKLYGHNAVHALAAYLGALLGATTIAELTGIPGVMDFLRAALVQESGAALVRKYAGVDPFFTPDGFAQAGDDLLARMSNPFLADTVARVGRDPARKLGWDDRLVGAMRLALAQAVSPRRYALGVAAALQALDRHADPDATLPLLWQPAAPDPSEQAAVLALVRAGWQQLAAWCAAGRPNLAAWFDQTR